MDKKRKKTEFIDDGHTIYDMNVDAKWNKLHLKRMFQNYY